MVTRVGFSDGVKPLAVKRHTVFPTHSELWIGYTDSANDRQAGRLQNADWLQVNVVGDRFDPTNFQTCIALNRDQRL